MKKFLAWGGIAGAVVGTAIKYKTAKKRKLISIGLIIVVIMIAIAAMMKMTTSD